VDARELFSCLRESVSEGFERITVLFRAGSNSTDSAAAAGVAATIRSLAKELGGRGFAVNGVCIHGDSVPPEGVCHAVQYLCLPEAAFITGQVVHVGRHGCDNSSKPPEHSHVEAPSLQGRVALVTGAARGIGAAIATRLAREGARVVGVDMPGGQSEEALRSRMAGLGGSAIPLDISTSSAPSALLSALAAARVSRTHVVVHNAGITRDKTLRRMKDEQIDAVLKVNLEAPVRLTAALASAGLIGRSWDGAFEAESPGSDRVVCISSISGIGGAFGQTNYAYSKAGIIGWAECSARVERTVGWVARYGFYGLTQVTFCACTLLLHLHMFLISYVKRSAAYAAYEGLRGVTFHAVAPGFIETDMVDTMPFFAREAGRRLNAFSQGGLPEDIASAVAFFAHPEANGLSGCTLRVCGGHMLGR
jgi:3-oxoacyl-[acyl-carrier protein] reductase